MLYYCCTKNLRYLNSQIEDENINNDINNILLNNENINNDNQKYC